MDRLLSPQERNRWSDIYARRLGFACALGIGFMLFLGVSLGAAIGSGRALTGRDLVIILLVVAAVLTVIVAYTRTLRTHRRRWRGAVDKLMPARVPVVISRRSSGKRGVFLDLSLPDGQSWHVRQEDGYRPFQVGDQVLTEIYPSDEGGCVGAIWADRTGTITRFSAATLPQACAPIPDRGRGGPMPPPGDGSLADQILVEICPSGGGGCVGAFRGSRTGKIGLFTGRLPAEVRALGVRPGR